MTTRMWKYEVPVDDKDHLIPFRIMHVAADTEVLLNAWCEVDPDTYSDARTIAVRVFGTGQPLPDRAMHIASVKVGPFVWHLYDTSLVRP